MNNKTIAFILLIFLFALINSVQADSKTCIEGDTQICNTSQGCELIQTCYKGNWTPPCNDTKICTTDDGCSGTQTCVKAKWGNCVKDDPSCGLKVSIVSPSNEDVYVISSKIEFKSNIESQGNDYSVEWDSNANGKFSVDENFDYSGLSIGDHNITLTGTFASGETPTTKTDSIQISVIPIPQDAVKTSGFEVINQTNPGQKITEEDTIEINTTVSNLTRQQINTETSLKIIDAESGTQMFLDNKNHLLEGQGGLGGNDTVNIKYTIKLSEFNITLGNYKIIFDVKKVLNEQNTENNQKTEIITVLKPSKEMNLNEFSVLILPVLLISIIIILKKEKIKKAIKKKKK